MDNHLESKHAQQIVTVVRIFTEDLAAILEGLSPNEQFTDIQMQEVMRGSIKKCADEFKISVGTVENKFTEQLGKISIMDFYYLLRDYVGKRNNDLEEKVVEYMKETLDNEIEIRKALQEARG